MNSKILSIKTYKKRGYVAVREVMGGSNYGSSDVEMLSAYSWPDLYYIGNSRDAYRLWKVRDITEFYPSHNYEPITELKYEERAKKLLSVGSDLQLKNTPVCNIGWSELHQKWYGWSHRAIYGFGIGSEVKRGDCGYVPSDKEDFIRNEILFWSDDNHENVHLKEEGVNNKRSGVWLGWTVSKEVQNEKMRGTIDGVFCEYPDKWGKGEWRAETWEEAKQMAIDFAEGVS